MAIPDPLVTIRTYSSIEMAQEDCRVLQDAGINAYPYAAQVRGSLLGGPGEVRVPESEVDRAVALLPPPAVDLLAPVSKPDVCPWCGSDRARYPSSLAGILVVVGVLSAAVLAIERQFEVAGLVVALTVWTMYVGKPGRGPECANCGREWRAPRAAPEHELEPEPEPEREQGTEPEHERRSENPEA